MMVPGYNLLRNLQPAFQPVVNRFLERAAEAGIPLSVVQGLRSPAQQAALYAEGRTTPGPIVTKAPPLSSYHNFGLAVDVVPLAYEHMPGWNPTGPLWGRLGVLGESLGLRWGGRFSTPDRPHFEWPVAPLAELKLYFEKFGRIMPVKATLSVAGLALAALLIVAWQWAVKKGYV